MASMDQVFAAYNVRVQTLQQSTHPFSKGVAWVKGQLVPLQEAQVPTLDQGFLRSDLTYDVPSVWNGRFFRLDDHLDRLEKSCNKIRLQLPLSKDEIKRILNDMVAQSGIQDAFVELIVTRGFRFVRGAKPEKLRDNNLYMFIMPYTWVMDPETQRNGGGRAIIARTVRRVPPGAIDPAVKNLQWGDLIRGLFEAQDRDAIYPFLTDGDAHRTDAGFNIYSIHGGVLYTPDRGVLEGVTRKSVVEAAEKAGVKVYVEPVPVEMAYEAEDDYACGKSGIYWFREPFRGRYFFIH